MRKSKIIIAILTIAVSIGTVFHIKHCVKELVSDSLALSHQIASDKEAIHILGAEWAYLNQPSRLKVLAAQYLQLSHILASQVKSEDGIAVADNHLENSRDYSLRVVPTMKPILSSAGRYE
jgi:hypothetical protein